MFNIFEEISWPQYAQMSHIAKLPLQEQINQYNQYLYDLSLSRQNWLDTQNKGPIEIYLAQEEYNVKNSDYFLILQEDGSNLIIT